MNEQNSLKSSYSIQATMLAVFLVFLVVLSSWLFMQRQWWLPEVASAHGVNIDRVFVITLVITGAMFIILQLSLAYFSLRYKDQQGQRVRGWLRPGLENRFALIAGLIIFGVDITLFALGETQWAKTWGPAPPDAELIEVTGEQFAWNFRYSGPDGAFGRTEPRLISISNPLGIDPDDPAGKDDIISINQLHIPEGKPVRFRLRTKDVIHSFFLPNFRVKQDVVPGMRIEIWFQPTRAGQFEIACAQLCGLGHYRMRAFLTVEPQAAFDTWIEEFRNGGN